jgi:hypothetical protein
MSTGKVIGFGFIWAALVALSFDLFKSSRAVDNRIA